MTGGRKRTVTRDGENSDAIYAIRRKKKKKFEEENETRLRNKTIGNYQSIQLK